jgi:hypothetical protein
MRQIYESAYLTIREHDLEMLFLRHLETLSKSKTSKKAAVKSASGLYDLLLKLGQKEKLVITINGQ